MGSVKMKTIETLSEDDITKSADALEDNMKYFKEIGDPVIDYYSKDLDNLMLEIKSYLTTTSAASYDMNSLQMFFTQLTNIVYFTSTNVERVGMLNDLSNMAYKDAFNNSMINKGTDSAKLTVAKLTAIAEQESLTESVLNFIYSRSYKILKAKVDGAEEMIRTLSKIISYKMQTMIVLDTNDDRFNVSTKQILNESK